MQPCRTGSFTTGQALEWHQICLVTGLFSITYLLKGILSTKGSKVNNAPVRIIRVGSRAPWIYSMHPNAATYNRLASSVITANSLSAISIAVIGKGFHPLTLLPFTSF